MPHILAIIGRPNVGKSTLFNRILGVREAIVDDLPGATRDRHYGTAEWAGKTFTLIDTGGYVPRSDDLFERAIREQAQIALEEADAVLFLVDALTGPTPIDEEIAAILRKSRKKVHLVVNKIDNSEREIDAAQFYRLGLGDPFTVSALGGRMIGDFLDEITSGIPLNGELQEKDERLKLGIIGKPNVGKSSLVNALIGKPRQIVTPVPGTTRDSIDSILRYQKEEIVLIDTAGLRRKSRITENVEFFSTLRALKCIDRCDVAILVLDAEAGVDRQDLRILESIAESRRGTIIAANKWDLVEKNDRTAGEYEASLKSLLRIYDYIPVMFVSALTKQRIYKLIDEQTKRVPTKKLNNLLMKVIEETPPSSQSGKEIRIKYVTQVKSNHPAFAFFTNEPKMIKDEYRRFLERKLREHFSFTGAPVSVYFRKSS